MRLVLSVEETNRLREQVGLKLIPISIQSDRHDGAKARKPGVSHGKNDIRISIEETNELRRRVGLKLIPVELEGDAEVSNYGKLVKERNHEDKIDRIRANLTNVKSGLKHQQMMSKGGLLDRMDDSVNGKAITDFDSWLDTVGKEVKRDFKTKKLSFKTNTKKTKEGVKDDTTEVNSENVKISHDKEEFDALLKKESHVILTLKDSNVLDDNEDEVFENRQLKYQENLKDVMRSREETGKLVSLNEQKPFEDEKPQEFTLLTETPSVPKRKRKLETLEIDFDSEDEGTGFNINFDDSEAHQRQVSKFHKRDVSKFKKSKKSSTQQQRKRTFDTELVDKAYKPVELVGDDEEEDDADATNLEEMLKMTRNASLKKNRALAKQEGISKTGEVAGKQEETIDKSSGEFLDENAEFLDNFKVIKEQSLDNEDNIKQNGMVASIVEQPELKSPADLVGNRNTERYKSFLDSQNDKNYGGISDILSVLQSKSDDSRYKSKEIKLVYTDDDGKVLNTKEAFKYMSHKFHGSKKK